MPRLRLETGLLRGIADQFWAKVDVGGDDECWEWRAGRIRGGYGRFHIARKGYYANRVAYALTHDHDPGELDVCHTCDNPPCCNPKHLFKATNRENSLDKMRKGRAKGNTSNHDMHRKITYEQEVELMGLVRSGMQYYRIAERFPLTATGVSAVARRNGVLKRAPFTRRRV